MLSARVIDSEAEFLRLGTEWPGLAERSDRADIFATWPWLLRWWEVFGKGSRLLVVAVRDEAGALVGAAPLQVRRDRMAGVPFRKLCFLGEPHSDRQCVLASERREEVEGAVAAAIAGSSRLWDAVFLDQLSDAGSLEKGLEAVGLRTRSEPSALCPFVSVEGTWTAYHSGLSKKFKRDLQNKYNRLKRYGRWSLDTTTDADAVLSRLPDLRAVEARSRKAGQAKAFLSDDRNLRFLAAFVSDCAARGWIDLSTLEVEGRTAAYLIGFRYRHRYLAYNMAYDDEFFQGSPGKLILNEKIRWCFEGGAGTREFDFLRGGTYIKSLWTDSVRENRRLTAFKRTPLSTMLHLLYARARPALKKLLGRHGG